MGRADQIVDAELIDTRRDQTYSRRADRHPRFLVLIAPFVKRSRIDRGGIGRGGGFRSVLCSRRGADQASGHQRKSEERGFHCALLKQAS